MKSKARREEVATALAATLEPQLSAANQHRKPAKGIAATLKKLAQQLVAQQRQQEKTTRREAAKAARQALVEKLARTLRPHLSTPTDEKDKTAKAITRTLTKLAGQLLNSQDKQKKAVPKPAATAAPASPAKPAQRPVPMVARPASNVAGKSIAAPQRTAAAAMPTASTPTA